MSRHRRHGHNRPGDQGSRNVEFEDIMTQWLSRSQRGFSGTCRHLW
jgi:hypothetical protein